ncbi:MAG: glycosyltransferase family 25 protein [Nitrospirae bacterium]|nr:MAG: glycosyltransferase family 25 protein [Nitrospirota bacterium]
MKAFLINLERAKERLVSAQRSLEGAGFSVVRVDAVDGRAPGFAAEDFSERSLRLLHGKRPNPSEIGCYFSHIRAISLFMESGDEFGLIAEDDITVAESCGELIAKCVGFREHWDMLRLSGLHHGTPLRCIRIADPYFLGICLTRQTGSGAYVINRKAARNLLLHLKVMRLPYDHAFDREWLFNFKTMVLVPLPVCQQTAGFPSQIAQSAETYKYALFMRYWTVFPYRAYNECSRVIYRILRYIKIKIGSRSA